MSKDNKSNKIGVKLEVVRKRSLIITSAGTLIMLMINSDNP